MSDEFHNTEALSRSGGRTVFALGRTLGDVDRELDLLARDLSIPQQLQHTNFASWQEIDDLIVSLGFTHAADDQGQDRLGPRALPLEASGLPPAFESVSAATGVEASSPSMPVDVSPAASTSSSQNQAHPHKPTEDDTAVSRHSVPIASNPQTDAQTEPSDSLAAVPQSPLPPPLPPTTFSVGASPSTEAPPALPDATLFEPEETRYAAIEDLLHSPPDEDGFSDASDEIQNFGDIPAPTLDVGNPAEPSHLETQLDLAYRTNEAPPAHLASVAPISSVADAAPKQLSLIDDEPLVLTEPFDALPLFDASQLTSLAGPRPNIVDDILAVDSTHEGVLIDDEVIVEPPFSNLSESIDGGPAKLGGDDLGELVFNVEPELEVGLFLTRPSTPPPATKSQPQAREVLENLELDLSEFMTSEEPALQPLPLLRPPPPPPQRSGPPPVPRASRPAMEADEIEELDVQDLELEASSSSPPAPSGRKLV